MVICVFVSLKAGVESSDGLIDELKNHVAKKIDSIARPDEILFAAELPKTRGKITRRLLRDIAERAGFGRYHDLGRSGGRGQAKGAIRGRVRSFFAEVKHVATKKFLFWQS